MVKHIVKGFLFIYWFVPDNRLIEHHKKESIQGLGEEIIHSLLTLTKSNFCFHLLNNCLNSSQKWCNLCNIIICIISLTVSHSSNRDNTLMCHERHYKQILNLNMPFRAPFFCRVFFGIIIKYQRFSFPDRFRPQSSLSDGKLLRFINNTAPFHSLAWPWMNRHDRFIRI